MSLDEAESRSETIVWKAEGWGVGRQRHPCCTVGLGAEATRRSLQLVHSFAYKCIPWN